MPPSKWTSVVVRFDITDIDPKDLAWFNRRIREAVEDILSYEHLRYGVAVDVVSPRPHA